VSLKLVSGGRAALYQLGLTGFPITNINNNCATGSTALFNAATLVRGGEARCALVLGFERMAAGTLSAGKNNAWQLLAGSS
jgi:sterol carrier protein 2